MNQSHSQIPPGKAWGCPGAMLLQALRPLLPDFPEAYLFFLEGISGRKSGKSGQDPQQDLISGGPTGQRSRGCFQAERGPSLPQSRGGASGPPHPGPLRPTAAPRERPSPGWVRCAFYSCFLKCGVLKTCEPSVYTLAITLRFKRAGQTKQTTQKRQQSRTSAVGAESPKSTSTSTTSGDKRPYMHGLVHGEAGWLLGTRWQHGSKTKSGDTAAVQRVTDSVLSLQWPEFSP